MLCLSESCVKTVMTKYSPMSLQHIALILDYQMVAKSTYIAVSDNSSAKYNLNTSHVFQEKRFLSINVKYNQPVLLIGLALS